MALEEILDLRIPMSDPGEFKPLRNKSKGVIWLSAILGLLILSLAADLIVFGKSGAAAWTAFVAGLVFVAFALWRAMAKD
jgi:uncharacterized membrane protein